MYNCMGSSLYSSGTEVAVSTCWHRMNGYNVTHNIYIYIDIYAHKHILILYIMYVYMVI